MANILKVTVRGRIRVALSIQSELGLLCVLLDSKMQPSRFFYPDLINSVFLLYMKEQRGPPEKLRQSNVFWGRNLQRGYHLFEMFLYRQKESIF